MMEELVRVRGQGNYDLVIVSFCENPGPKNLLEIHKTPPRVNRGSEPANYVKYVQLCVLELDELAARWLLFRNQITEIPGTPTYAKTNPETRGALIEFEGQPVAGLDFGIIVMYVSPKEVELCWISRKSLWRGKGLEFLNSELDDLMMAWLRHQGLLE